MTPAPMTTRRLGTASRERAPVDEMIVFSSMGMEPPGNGVTSEPVARIMRLALMLLLPPSFNATLMSVVLVSVPWPLT